MVSVTAKLPRLEDGEIDLQAWLARFAAEYEHLESDQVEKTVVWLSERPNVPVHQCLELAELVAELRLDVASVKAALIYPGLRRGVIESAQVAGVVGAEPLGLASDVLAMATSSLLGVDDTALLESHQEDQVENIRRMLASMIKDFRVAVLKLAERLLALRYAKRYDENRRRRIAHEAGVIFAPLANRMGMWQLKWELEDLSLRYLREDIYLGIAKELNDKRQERERQISERAQRIQELLAGVGIQAEVKGRAKNIFGIWRKMQRKGISLDQVHDVRAVRIVVESLADCYAALGVIHSNWPHIPSEFDDYIAMPKENGYQSIHTAISIEDGRTLEVQIRTRQMHEQAELGVCAHWAYKVGGATGSGAQTEDPYFAQKMDWLRQVMEWHEELGGMEDLRALLAQGVSDERVYITTPRGHVVELAAGATVLDFAYRIHTELGHSCTGGLVNGRKVPVDAVLQTGQTVEIQSIAPARPHRAWLEPSLKYVHTHRARAKIASYFRAQPEAKRLARGRLILRNVFTGAGFRLPDEAQLTRLAEALGHSDVAAMYQAVAVGVVSYIDLVAKVLTEQDSIEGVQLQPAPGLEGEDVFPRSVGFQLNADNRQDLLRDITDQLGRLDLPIQRATGEVGDSDQAVIRLEVLIPNWQTCLRLLSHLAYLRGVIEVRRCHLS